MPRADASIEVPRTSRALLALWALFWLLMVVVAIEDHRGPGIVWWEPLVWEGSSCLVASFWLLLERRAALRWHEHVAQPLRWLGLHVAWLPLVAVTFVGVVYTMRHGVYALTDEIYEHRSWAFLFFYETVKLVLFASLWLGIIFGLESFALWQRERERLLALEKHLAESQLEQLRSQLAPHFLFNTLNTISSLMQVDVARADKLLTQLADLLRASLQASAAHMTSLREELKLLDLYAQIMQARFTGRVNVSWSIDDAALDAAIPVMLLQPLLENAFKHGVERSREPVTITIDARREGARQRVTIKNSGATLGPQPAPGIGLANCRERLELLFGGRARIDLTEDESGVSTELCLPWQRHIA